MSFDQEHEGRASKRMHVMHARRHRGAGAGLFVLEMNNPMLLFDGSIVASADTWEIDVDDAQLEVLWGAEGDAFDAFAQVLRKTVEVTVMHRGGEQQRLRETVPLRQFTFQELCLIAEQSGFKVRAACCAWSCGPFVPEGGLCCCMRASMRPAPCALCGGLGVCRTAG